MHKRMYKRGFCLSKSAGLVRLNCCSGQHSSVCTMCSTQANDDASGNAIVLRQEVYCAKPPTSSLSPNDARCWTDNYKSGNQEPGTNDERGCHCRKSRCLKKYCQCYQAQVKCSDACRCAGRPKWGGHCLVLAVCMHMPFLRDWFLCA